MDIKELQLYADQLYKKAGGIRAVFSKNEKGVAFVVCGDGILLELVEICPEGSKKMTGSSAVAGGIFNN